MINQQYAFIELQNYKVKNNLVKIKSLKIQTSSFTAFIKQLKKYSGKDYPMHMHKDSYNINASYMNVKTLEEVLRDYYDYYLPREKDFAYNRTSIHTFIDNIKNYINSIYAKFLINEEQSLEITNRLKNLRIKWNIFSKGQQVVLYGNLLEELTELARAKDEYEAIDALLDISVFMINATDNYQLKEYLLKYVKLENNNLHTMVQLCSNYFEPITRNHTKATEIVRFALETIYALGYNPYKCFIEVLKHLESREQDPKQKQEWLEKKAQGIKITEKFMKDKTIKVYEPNYESCKLTKYELEDRNNPFFKVKTNEKEN